MMQALTVAAIAALSSTAQAALNPDKDDLKQFREIVHENGYALEHYSVITDDDYVNTLYRIPGKFTKEKPTEPKPAVLFMHSQDWDMTQWVSNDAERSNAFILSEQGYDVWMGNNRGSSFSKGHLKYTRKDFEYWQFYQEDLGTYDVPAFIDFVTEKTGLEKISIIGHSMGTNQVFMGMSLLPEYYTSKVNVYAAMAPPVFIRSMTDPHTLKLAAHWQLLQDLFEKLHIYNFITASPLIHAELIEACALIPGFCELIEKKSEFLIPSVDNMERARVMLNNFPSGSGYRCTIYWGQVVNSGGLFQKFDYGKDANMKIYGQTAPPEIPIENINVPIALFNGSLDAVVFQPDVDYLAERLGDNMIHHQVIEGDHWTFSMAQDMSWFKEDLVQVLQTYNPTTPQEFLQ